MAGTTCPGAKPLSYRVTEAKLDLGIENYAAYVEIHQLYATDGPPQVVIITCTDWNPIRRDLRPTRHPHRHPPALAAGTAYRPRRQPPDTSGPRSAAGPRGRHGAAASAWLRCRPFTRDTSAATLMSTSVTPQSDSQSQDARVALCDIGTGATDVVEGV